MSIHSYIFGTCRVISKFKNLNLKSVAENGRSNSLNDFKYLGTSILRSLINLRQTKKVKEFVRAEICSCRNIAQIELY